MIIAGTVSAYLKLSIDDFRANLTAAILLMGHLRPAAELCSSGIQLLESAAARTSSALLNSLGGALRLLSADLGTVAGPAGAACVGLINVGSAAVQSSAQITGAIPAAAAAISMCSISMNSSFSSASSAAAVAGAGISAAMNSAASGASAGMLGVASSVSILSGAQSTALTLSNGISANVLSPINALPPKLRSAMSSAGQGMIEGLRSKIASIIALAKSIASQVISTIQSALQIASPSKVMRRIGAYSAEGLALGLEDMLPRVSGSAAEVARAVELSSAAVMAVPPPVSVHHTAPSAAPAASSPAGAQYDLSALTERMDRLLDYFTDTQPVLRLDGRTFGRMVREYS